MRLGIGSYTYPFLVASHEMDHFDLLDRGIDLGAEAIQYCENLSLNVLEDSDLGKLVSLAARHKIQIEVGTRGLDAHHLMQTAQMARRVGAEFFRLVIHEQGSCVSIEQAARALSEMLPGFDGVTVAIENHDHFPAEALRALVEELGTPCAGVTLDTANSLGCLEGTREVVRTLAPLTRCLHVKDVTATRIETNLGFSIQGATAGHGSVDIPWVLSQAPDTCHSVILEQWTPSLPMAPTPRERELESARTGFAYLRRLMQFKPGAPPKTVCSA